MEGSEKKLILFTLQYPYSNTESFLETEIPYLLEEFDTITVVPRDLHSNIREVVDRVKVDSSFAKSIPSGSKMVMAIITALLTNVDIYKEIVQKPHLLVRFKSIKLLLYYAVIKNVIKKWYSNQQLTQPTLFYTYWIESFTYGLCELKKRHDLNVVCRTHRYDLYEESHSRPYLPFRREVFKAVDQIFPVSEEGEKYLLNKYGLSNDKVQLARLGINGQDKSTLSPVDDELNIVSCSNVIALKRIDLIIDGIVELSNSHPSLSISWTHFGDGEAFDEIKQYAQNNLPLSVKWKMQGVVRNSEVLEYYTSNSIDVLINLSTIEGVPVSIMEAFNCSIPVVATDVGGVSEIVDKKNGILISANPSIAEVAQALDVFSSADIQAINRFKQAAYDTWHSKYDAEDNYRKFTQTLLSFLSK